MAKASNGLRWIWAVIGVWAVLLAIGTSQFAPDPSSNSIVSSTDWRRGAVVLGAVGTFLGLWIFGLAKRTSRGFGNGSSVTGHRGEGIQTSQQHHDHQQQQDT